jgi:drug/metabolite transporter (DMT)-like permease
MTARLAGVLAALFWAGNFAVGRVIAGQIPPVTLSFLRWSVALCVLLPFAISRLAACRGLLRDHYRWFLGMSLAAVVYNTILVYSALEHTTATNVALIMAATPAMTLFLSALLHGERYGWYRVGVVSLSFAGIVVLVWQRLSVPNAGDLLACVAMSTWAYYNVSMRDSPVNIDGITLTAIITAIGLVLMAPLLGVELALRGRMTLSPEVLLAVLYVGLFASGLAYLLWNRAVMFMGAIHAAQFMNLVPLFGVLIGTVLLDEPFSSRHALAAVLIMAGLLLSEYRRLGQAITVTAGNH